MPTPIAFVGAFAALLTGDGIILLIERFAENFMQDHDETRSILRAESSLGFWGSAIFVLVLTVLVFILVQIVLPLLNISQTPINFAIIAGGAFVLGIVLNIYRNRNVPPPFITTTIAFSLLTISYSIVRWLFSEVATFPPATSEAGNVVIGLAASTAAVTMILGEAASHGANTESIDASSTGRLESEKTSRTRDSDLEDSSDISSRKVGTGELSPSTRRDNNRTGSVHSNDRLGNTDYDWGYSSVRFDDIGGYYDVKQTLVEDIIEPLRAAERGDDRFDRFGIQPERGILLYGPPGTGKTLFARALAGELNIPFVELSPSDVTSKWINEGPDRIKQLFDEASRIGPSVIFIDEAEHLFGARATDSRNTHAEDRKVTTEFLVHLTRDDREAIVVAATNRPGDIDPAILRPGRLTAHYEIGLPDSEARHAILQSKLRGVPAALSGDQLAELADHTRGFTGADLENLVDDAKRSAAKRDGDAVTIDDFPSFTELDRRVADIERAYESSALPDPDDHSEMTPPTDDTDADDDSAVGYQ